MYRIYLVLVPLFLASHVVSFACPMHQLQEAGLLNEADAEKYDAIKRDSQAAETLLELHKRSPDPLPESKVFSGLIGPVVKGLLDLPLGGGLLNGVLQPLTGRLSGVLLPTPQPAGLRVIPGSDANHQYIKPGGTDVRGVCPPLNTLANHGYVSRSGITTLAEAANAVQIGYGFSYDLATLLGALGVITGGDLLTGKFSIGGADSRVPNTLGPSLGLDKHGTFEVDNSITRQDAYFGNQANFLASRWDRLNNIRNQNGGGQFGRETMRYDGAVTYDESRSTNPQFNAGIKWLIVAFGARGFIYRGLPNGTTPNVADYPNIAPFFLIETFPQEWYRRDTPYGLEDLVTDILDLYLHPGTGSPRELGANAGLNNFAPSGYDPSTKSVDALSCFFLEQILDAAPGFVQPALVDNLDLFTGFVKGVIAPFFSSGCNITDYAVPSASAGEDTTGSASDDGPAIVNGVYQPNS